MTIEEKLISRTKENKDGCWEWQGALRNGYGAIKIDSKLWGAHRLSYTTFNGIIPNNLYVCHACDNPKCINPNHLFACTGSQNMLDAKSKGRLVVPVGVHYKIGHIPVNKEFSNDTAAAIRAYTVVNPTSKLRDVAKLFKVKYQFVRDLRRKTRKLYTS